MRRIRFKVFVFLFKIVVQRTKIIGRQLLQFNNNIFVAMSLRKNKKLIFLTLWKDTKPLRHYYILTIGTMINLLLCYNDQRSENSRR